MPARRVKTRLKSTTSRGTPITGEVKGVAEAIATSLERIAGSSDPLPERAQELLETLEVAVPFDAAWLAAVDPLRSDYVTLASVGLNDHVVHFLGGPVMAHDIEVTGNNRDRPPMSPSDLPYPAEELSSWSECLIPAGFHQALAVALFAPGGRHVGFLSLLFGSGVPPARAARRRLAALAPVVARGVDPMPSLLSTARLVRGATAGTVLHSDQRTESLPGLDAAPVLAEGSNVVDMASERLADGNVYSSFLWPLGGSHAPDGHARVTVLAAPEDLPDFLEGVVLLSQVRELYALTPRELEVLGLVADGCSNAEVAQALVLAPRTVAAHIEHLLLKLDATTRTLAAVRAERKGLYVPTLPQSPSDGGTNALWS
jgi:DNA-binding CsgD family transcriptional regulator